MSAAAAWLGCLALHARSRGRRAEHWRWLAIGLALGLLPFATFWRAVASAFWQGEALPLSMPTSAWLGVWALALVTIGQRRIDGRGVSDHLVAALAAAAAVGIAVDTQAHLTAMLAALELEKMAWLSWVLVGTILPTGLALALSARPSHPPWEYPPWYLVLLALAGSELHDGQVLALLGLGWLAVAWLRAPAATEYHTSPSGAEIPSRKRIQG